MFKTVGWIEFDDSFEDDDDAREARSTVLCSLLGCRRLGGRGFVAWSVIEDNCGLGCDGVVVVKLLLFGKKVGGRSRKIVSRV